MAQLFFQPVWQAVDANGAPLSGALLYFFETGSSTPLTVYQDSGLGTPHAIPVVADTAGMFAPIYVNVAQYKVVLKTSAGVTVQTVDPVSVNGGNTTLESTDSGATAGPILTLLRSSDIAGNQRYYRGSSFPGQGFCREHAGLCGHRCPDRRCDQHVRGCDVAATRRHRRHDDNRPKSYGFIGYICRDGKFRGGYQTIIK
jgi:hypothetical protein